MRAPTLCMKHRRWLLLLFVFPWWHTSEQIDIVTSLSGNPVAYIEWCNGIWNKEWYSYIRQSQYSSQSKQENCKETKKNDISDVTKQKNSSLLTFWLLLPKYCRWKAKPISHLLCKPWKGAASLLGQVGNCQGCLSWHEGSYITAELPWGVKGKASFQKPNGHHNDIWDPWIRGWAKKVRERRLTPTVDQQSGPESGWGGHIL